MRFFEEASRLLGVCRNIVLNPIRAGMVEIPQQWKWSRYRSSESKGKPHSGLTTDWVLWQFSVKRDKGGGIGEKSIGTEVKGQVILGEDEFANRLADYLKTYQQVPEILRSQR